MVRESVIKILNNAYNTGLCEEQAPGRPIMPVDGYDENPEQTAERARYHEILYGLFEASEWYRKYHGPAMKVEKNDLKRFYTYMYDGLSGACDVTPFEAVLAVCSFADLPYEYVWKHVVPVEVKARIYEDLYADGYGRRIDRAEALY